MKTNVFIPSFVNKGNFMRTFLMVWMVCLSAIPSFAQFDTYFRNKTLRFDYIHGGNRDQEYFFFTELIEEPDWGGSTVSLIDEKGYGNLMFKIFDEASGTLI